MASLPRVVYRVEPEEPDLVPALRNVEYGAPMDEDDIAKVKSCLGNILDLLLGAAEEEYRHSENFLTCFKSDVNWDLTHGEC
jgi:hypothetical protein